MTPTQNIDWLRAINGKTAAEAAAYLLTLDPTKTLAAWPATDAYIDDLNGEDIWLCSELSSEPYTPEDSPPWVERLEGPCYSDEYKAAKVRAAQAIALGVTTP